MNALLDRIFDEFGLIVSGWSAEWDTALRAALERCKSHRFTTYWTVRGKAGEVAKRLITFRRGEIIKTQDADSFFKGLAEKVAALEDVARPHPLSAKVAVATVKRYLVDDRYKIRLHDLVMEELNKLDEQVSDAHFNLMEIETEEELKRRVERYQALTEISLAIMITGSYWGEQSHLQLWVQCLERLAYRPISIHGRSEWMRLRLYPALLLLYGGGIAALAHGKYDTFAAFLTKAMASVENKEQSLILAVHIWTVMGEEFAKQLPNMQNHISPLSDHLYNVLREPLKEYLPLDIRYEEYFDRFEYLLALIYADLNRENCGHIWAPLGCIRWRGRGAFNLGAPQIMKKIESEVAKEGENWPLLKAGLFDKSVERFQAIKTDFDNWVLSLH